jgi:hypothetical protein
MSPPAFDADWKIVLDEAKHAKKDLVSAHDLLHKSRHFAYRLDH